MYVIELVCTIITSSWYWLIFSKKLGFFFYIRLYSHWRHLLPRNNFLLVVVVVVVWAKTNRYFLLPPSLLFLRRPQLKVNSPDWTGVRTYVRMFVGLFADSLCLSWSLPSQSFFERDGFYFFPLLPLRLLLLSPSLKADHSFDEGWCVPFILLFPFLCLLAFFCLLFFLVKVQLSSGNRISSWIESKRGRN